jgi:hypothetical protein
MASFSFSALRRAPVIALLSTILALLGGAVAPPESDAARCSVQNGYGSFANPTAVPGPCWRPYADSSPFNAPIAKRPRVAAGSRATVSELVGRSDGLDYFVAGDDEHDGGTSIFFSSPDDPLYTVHCTFSEQWTPCDIEGMQIPVPPEATPAGGYAEGTSHDAHMTIVDQTTGWEYDLWNVRSLGDGELVTGYGGRTQVTGAGLGSDGVAARFGNLAGVIRYQELAAGRIDHALSLVVPCTSGFVYPAQKSDFPCESLGVQNGPAMGSRFQLNIPPKTIAKMKVPKWKKTILRALQRYGAYVSDTSGNADWWALKFESSYSYTSFGAGDPWTAYAERLGLEEQDYNGNGQGEYWFDLASDVPWDKLRIVK